MTAQSSDKITRPQMRDALLRSGYLLESRVETSLRERGGYVEANATYPDLETGKSREFDVHAMFAHQAGPEEHDFLFSVLLVECINNPQPLVILTKEPLVGFLHREEVKISGLPVKVPDKEISNGWCQLPEFLGMEKYHHYCKGRIGTQFCSFTKKKGGRVEEWMALHEGSHFDSFRKLCDITDYFVDKHFKSWTFDTRENLNLQIHYPVIIVQGDLVDARQTKRSVTLWAADHLQFRRSVTTKGNEVNFQIDVVRERFFPKYLDLIEGEVRKTVRLLRRRHEIVRSGIDRIAAEAKNATSPEQIRQIMDKSP
jgi:hypothetical protein